jgi:transporter family protein
MTWGILTIVSAILLGVYDFLKKVSLKNNTVLPVLLISTASGALVFVPFVLVSRISPHLLENTFAFVPPMPLKAHLMFMLKSVIVGSSWVFNYFAIKHLPLTVAGPIRSSGPLWTLAGALLIFGEVLTPIQWIGLAVTLAFYYLFSLSGAKEGISFRTNKWVFFLTIGTVIGSISSLYDKYLVSHYDKMAMQAWYLIYMVPLMALIVLIFWYPQRHKFEKFIWRNTIPLIGICLAFADFLYFWALSKPDGLIALVSTLRRGSVVVSFAMGAIIFREKNIARKGLILIGILVGIGLILMGK